MSAVAPQTPLELARRFWRWWTAELRECIPTRFVAFLTRLSVLPLVVPEGDGYSIYRFDGTNWKRIAGVRAGDSTEATAKALGAQLKSVRAPRFAVALPNGQFLSKILQLPAVAEENLRNAIGYELDRHTPFKPEDVGYDCCVVERNETAREIAVRLVIAPKANIAQAMERVAGSGVLVAAVQPAFPDRASLSLNMLPHEDTAHGPLERVRRWAPWAVVAALAGIAIVLPVWQKRAQVIELQPQVMLAARDAQAADQLHQQLERAQGEYNFLLQKRYSAPTTLQLLNEVTRILPDDTWLQNFEFRSTSKGKELQLQGETGVAGKMIELFEQSPLFTNASFKSPVTQAPGSQASRFHLGMDVKEGVPPALATAAIPQTVAPAGSSTTSAPVVSTTAPGSATTPAPASSAGASAQTAPAMPAPSTAATGGAAPAAPGGAANPASRSAPRSGPPVIQNAPATQPTSEGGAKSMVPVVAANDPSAATARGASK